MRIKSNIKLTFCLRYDFFKTKNKDVWIRVNKSCNLMENRILIE